MSLRALALLVPPLAVSVALAAETPLAAPDADRGHDLYAQRCGECHDTSVHGREHRVAHDMIEVRQWVRRWSEHLKLGWGEREVEDVAAYLNATYYRFTCDTASCRAVTLAPSPPRR